MSRLAKKPIPIPEGITLECSEAFVVVKGPKGEIRFSIPRGISVSVEPTGAAINSNDSSQKIREDSMYRGTAAALLRNAIQGVSFGFSKKLEIEGVGYKANMDGRNLVLSLGFSHPVRFNAPSDILLSVEKNTIIVSGADKELVGRAAAEIRALKPPEPYKGKGIHYVGEVIRRKAGKKAVGTT